MNSPYLDEYKKQMVESIQRIRPDWDEEFILDVVDKRIDEKMQVVPVELDNNVTGDHHNTSLNAVYDWIVSRKPIIAGNGTFYKQQHQQKNPNGVMLQNLKKERSYHKKKMFEYPTGSHEYLMEDLTQSNKKIDMNAYYGGSGMPKSPTYSKWSGPATTLSAQSVISTTEQMFESFIADNYQFINITEFLNWINVVIEEEPETDDWICHHTRAELKERFLLKIIKPSEYDNDIVNKLVNNLSQEQMDILYYKNNLIAFINDHKEISSIIEDILTSVNNLEYTGDKDHDKKVNKEYFMDPNDPPDSIKDHLELLKEYVMKYVYCNYLSFDRIYRLRNLVRKCVTVIDTDSNILSFDTIMDFIKTKIVKGRNFGREDKYNDFILVNTITYLTTEAVGRILYLYGKKSNVDEEFISFLGMKNEFFFAKLIIGNAKKRYISKMLLREGNLVAEGKSLDVKGFDFKKATCSDYAEGVFVDIIKDTLINNEIDVREMMRRVVKFRDTIEASIRSGDTSLLNNVSVKEMSAYANPASQLSVRAVYTWNILYPDDSIEFPAKCSLLKLKAFTPDDIECIKDDYPDVYKKLMKYVFEDTTGLFITSKQKENKKTGEIISEVQSKGLQGLAIPANRKIPDWALELVDWSTTINNIIAPFNGILNIFGCRSIEEGKSYNNVDRKSDRYTNLIKF